MDRSDFSKAIAGMDLTHAERAIALLWFYRQTQQYEDRTVSELACDLEEEEFPKPNVTRLREKLRRSSQVIRSRRPDGFRISVRKLGELDDRYAGLLDLTKADVTSSLLPREWVAGTRTYLERMVHQINGSYQYGFYDACAVMCRRLMESLIIEVYVTQGRHQEIQRDGLFLPLEPLINHVKADGAVPLNRNTPKTMLEVKEMGDTTAHDRVYITDRRDIDDVKARYKKVINELLVLAGIKS